MPPYTLGVDVSHYEGNVDWARVLSAGYSFGFCKASQGDREVDPQFIANWTAMSAAGITRGAYHFFQPGVNGAAQADHFLATVPRLPTDLPPTLDVEQAPGDVAVSEYIEEIQAFCDKIQAATGHKPILYTYIPFWRDTLGDPKQFSAAGHPLWIARYTPAETPGDLPGGWTEWTFWQYAAPDPGAPHVDVPGIGISDVDRFEGSHVELLKRFGI